MPPVRKAFSVGLLTMAFAQLWAPKILASDDDLAVIKRQSQEFSDASAAGDAGAMERLLNENVVFINESGEIATKRDLIESAAKPAAGVSNQLVQSDLVIKLHGNVAVTSFTDNSTANVFGQVTKARFVSTEVWLKEKEAWKMISSQTVALADDPKAMAMSADVLDQYVGDYEAAPKLTVKVSRSGDGLISATNGGEPHPLLAEAPDVLFTPGQARVRRIFERDASGKIVGFNARHEGHDIYFKRTA